MVESDEKREKMQNKRLEAEKRMENEREHRAPEETLAENVERQAAQDVHQQAAHEAAERHAKELLAEEGLTITAESKRKDKKKKKKSKEKQLSKDKKAVEEAEEVADEVAEEIAEEIAEDVAEEVHESDAKVLEEKQEEKGRRSTLAEKREPQKFELTTYVTMEELINISFLGSTMLNTTKVKKIIHCSREVSYREHSRACLLMS